MRSLSVAFLLACGGASAALAQAAPATVPKSEALDSSGTLVFHKADDSPVSKAIYETFVKPMLKQAPSASDAFLWARYDVDGDGYDELFLAFAAPGQCAPDVGCPIVALRRSAEGNWRPILTGAAASVAIRPDPPRKSSIVVMAAKVGSRTWAWDPKADAMTERPRTDAAAVK